MSEPPRVAFDHHTASQTLFLQERQGCLQESRGLLPDGEGETASPDNDAMDNCMLLLGYTRNNIGGRLVVPPDMVVGAY